MSPESFDAPRPVPEAVGEAPSVHPRADAATMRVLAEIARFRITGEQTDGVCSLVELRSPPAGGIAAHAHDDADELLYVVSGSYHVRVGDLDHTLSAGGSTFVPRGTMHAFANVCGEVACLLVFSVPASSPERLFVEMAAAFAHSLDQSHPFVAAFRSIAVSRGVVIEPPPVVRSLRIVRDDE